MTELKYTSTYYKFLKHPDQLKSYCEGTGRTIISTHISPEGSCNLGCHYCSVSRRDTHERIELGVIQDYITMLSFRGLKAVIITGGGEPTLYPEFDELVRWIHSRELKIALITNGTCKNVLWDLFTWVRISLNNLDKVYFPKIKGTLGCSIIYTGQSLGYFKEVERLIKGTDVEYVRVVPDCRGNQKELIKNHLRIDEILKELNNNIFFHQHKLHRTPEANVCHQAYFRPYLSEVNGGTVFPCDSLVLNNSSRHFTSDYAICKAEDILNFMDGKIKMKFNPINKCSGCVFTNTVDVLNAIKMPMTHF